MNPADLTDLSKPKCSRSNRRRTKIYTPIIRTKIPQTPTTIKWFAYLDLYYKQTDHSNIDGVSKSGKLYLKNGISDFAATRYDKTFSRGGSITIGKNIDTTSAISFNAGLSVNTQDKGQENGSDNKQLDFSAKISVSHSPVKRSYF